MGNNFHHFSLCPEIIPKHHKKWKNQAVGGWNVEKIRNSNPKLFHNSTRVEGNVYVFKAIEVKDGCNWGSDLENKNTNLP